MKKGTVVIRFYMKKKNKTVDLDIPLNITANDLVAALNTAYDLGIDTVNIKNCYLVSENPIALLKGTKTLAEYGIHDGTKVSCLI